MKQRFRFSDAFALFLGLLAFGVIVAVLVQNFSGIR